MYSDSVADRVIKYSVFDDNGCMNWSAHCMPNVYGTIGLSGGVKKLAHRVSHVHCSLSLGLLSSDDPPARTPSTPRQSVIAIARGRIVCRIGSDYDGASMLARAGHLRTAQGDYIRGRIPDLKDSHVDVLLLDL